MSKADIWMPFYVSDYLADTMHLTPAEHGAYLMLILHYWKSGPLPDDDVRLALISRMGDAWSNASSTLRAFFKHSSGMLHHTRIDKEKSEAVDNKVRNHARATDAAAKRWAKHASSNATSIPQAMLNECPSPSPSPSLNTNTVGRTAAKRRQQIPGDFYPNETGLSKASEKGLSVAIELTKFSDYHRGKGSVMADWQAAWRTWIGNARPANQQTETVYQRSMREKMDAAIGRNRQTEYPPQVEFVEMLK